MYNFNFDSSFRLIKLGLFLSIFFNISCMNEKFKDYPRGKITLESGEVLKVYIADTFARQKQGLSKLPSSEFDPLEAMIFPENEMDYRQFWMPETHFNLDIIFLNKDMYVLDIHKNISHFTTREPNHLVPRSKTVYAQHVLEIRADSPVANKIKPGMILKWSSSVDLVRKE